MNRAMIILLLTMVAVASASAETWVAICNDGQRLQYNQVRGGEGSLILQPKPGFARGAQGGLVVARLRQTFAKGDLICGTVKGSATGRDGYPVTQICANKRQRSLFIRYKHPYEDKPLEGMAFCDADVTIR